MTVAELIARLSEFPPDLPVIVNGTRNELANGQDAETVEILDQSRRHGDTWDVEYYPDQPPFWDDEERRKAVNIRAGDYNPAHSCGEISGWGNIRPVRFGHTTTGE